MTNRKGPKLSKTETFHRGVPGLEFSRRLMINRIGHEGLTETIKANQDECLALAGRFILPAVRAFACRFKIIAESDDHFVLEGLLTAHVVLECVITGETFEDALNETFVVRLVPARRFSEETGSDIEAIDEIPYEGSVLDLGEIAAEQLALMLPPYPRKRGAALENAVDEAPRWTEEENADNESGRRNQFAALAGLPLSKKMTDLS